MSPKPDWQHGLPIASFASPDEWEAWIEEQPQDTKGLWMKIAKRGSGVETLLHPEALESALCFGWIDGQRRSLDDRYFLQRFGPRGRKSTWSRINREKAEALIAAGRMRPAGLAEVERARADGRWEAAYEPQSTATVPEDLQRELDRNPRAKAFFETLDSRNRYAILFRLQGAKRPETRARRIERFVAMLDEGETIYG